MSLTTDTLRAGFLAMLLTPAVAFAQEDATDDESGEGDVEETTEQTLEEDGNPAGGAACGQLGRQADLSSEECVEMPLHEKVEEFIDETT